MFNLLPAIALLSLVLLWFGLGKASLIFVIVHAVLWPLALGAYAGFQGVPDTSTADRKHRVPAARTHHDAAVGNATVGILC